MKLFCLILLAILIPTSYLGQNLIPKQKKKKWGFVDKNDEWVIKPKFHEVKKFSEGYACVRVKNKWGYIDRYGKKITPLKYSAAIPFANGLAAVRSSAPLPGNTRANNNQYKWGYIDITGTIVIPLSFRFAHSFDSKGRALVELFKLKKGETFWIDKSGQAISPPFIEKIKVGKHYKIINQRNGKEKVYRYIKETGTPITEWYLNDFALTGDLIKVWLPSNPENDTIETNAFKGNSKKKLCAYMDQNGTILSDWYSEIKSFKNGYAPVRHHHLYGFIDRSFNLTQKPLYREISLINDSTYKAQIEYGKSVLLNIKGVEKSLYCHEFELYADDFFLGVHQLKSSYRNETKYAVFSAYGKQITGWYNKVNDIHNNIIRVEDDRPQYIDNKLKYIAKYNYVSLTSGELISDWRPASHIKWQNKPPKDSLLSYLFMTNPIIELDHHFFEKMFVKEFDLDHRGKKITFSGGDFHNGMALVALTTVEKETQHHKITTTSNCSKYGYIDWNGDLIIPYKYEEAGAFRDEYAVIRKNGKYGAINSKGKKVIPEKYNLLGAYGSGLFPFLDKEGKWGYINRSNRIQINPIFDNAQPFSYGYASVKKGRYWGLIDVMGKEIMPFNYQKPIVVISPKKVKYLESGVGYIEKNINEL
ncbi:MAG: WG repeat-containing protein [Flavobacteriales bacterium]|jgi:hypothetical protein|nr:WG repeat-containing protein [Flavobacteriales bacterium]